MTDIQAINCQSCFAPLDTASSPGNIIRCDFCGTDNALEGRIADVKTEFDSTFRSRFTQAMVRSLSLEDIKNICIHISPLVGQNVQYECIPGGDMLGSKCRELYVYFERRGWEAILYRFVVQARPNILVLLSGDR